MWVHSSRKALEKLYRPWFAGGTITWASVLAESHSLSPGSEGFEDGTLNYTSLPAVEIGLDFLDSVGMDKIHNRVNALAGWLLEELYGLRHRNGARLARVYGPLEMEARGGPKGGPSKFEIHNPGAGEMAMGLERGEILTCLRQSGDRMSLTEFQQCIDGKSTGAVRVSFGIGSNFADALMVLRFFQSFLRG